jgi:hypothetical protein
MTERKNTNGRVDMRAGNERGMALVAVMFVMLLLLGMGAAMHTGTIAETTLRGAHARATAGFYAAEAGINRGMGDYRNIFLSYNVPSGSDFDMHTISIGPRTVRYQLAQVPCPPPPSECPPQVRVPAGKPFAGLNATEYRYTATAWSELTTNDTEASLGTEFDVDYIPLFQFLAFYAGDLEILPGNDMTLQGAIHTNGSLYLNSSDGRTLTITDNPPGIPAVHLSASGDVIRRRKDDSSVCTGTVQIARLVDEIAATPPDLQTMPCAGVQSSSQLASWLGAVRSHQPVVSVPSPDSIQRGSGNFWTQADLRIVLNVYASDSTHLFPIVVQNAAGNTDATKNARLQAFMAAKPGRIFYTDVPESGKDNVTTCTTSDSYCNPTSYDPDFPAPNAANKVYACPASDVITYGCAGSNQIVAETLSTGDITMRRGGFYSNREGKWVRMLNVNMHDLLAWNMAQTSANQLFDPADATDGGLVIFLSVAGPNSNGFANPRYGVRVFGSPHLDFPALADPTGLTVVSDQAMYVEGDYNAGDAGNPKQPAALIGDTLNVLSNNWSSSAACRNDCQSRQTLAARPAASTIINSAFISGVDLTSSGNYNGGLENYPRFHESWSGATLTYRGSFVSLGAPLHNNGAWCGTGGSSSSGCNIYNPPVRNWNYDPDFQNVANLPPLTPRFVSVQQIIFTENFR